MAIKEKQIRCQKIILNQRERKPRQCNNLAKVGKEYCQFHRRSPNEYGDATKYEIKLEKGRPTGQFANLNTGKVFIPTELHDIINEVLECEDNAALATKFGPAVLSSLLDLATNASENIIRAKVSMYLYDQFKGKARERIEVSGSVTHNLGMIYLPVKNVDADIIDMDTIEDSDTNIKKLEADIMQLVENMDPSEQNDK